MNGLWIFAEDLEVIVVCTYKLVYVAGHLWGEGQTKFPYVLESPTIRFQCSLCHHPYSRGHSEQA